MQGNGTYIQLNGTRYVCSLEELVEVRDSVVIGVNKTLEATRPKTGHTEQVCCSCGQKDSTENLVKLEMADGTKFMHEEACPSLPEKR